MTFEDLLDILAEQFSCDAAELSEDTSFEDLGVGCRRPGGAGLAAWGSYRYRG